MRAILLKVLKLLVKKTSKPSSAGQMNISYGPLTNRLLVVFRWGCVYESFIRIEY